MIVLVDEIEQDLDTVHRHIMVELVSTMSINQQLLCAEMVHTLVFFTVKYKKPEPTRVSLLCCTAPELQTKARSHSVQLG